MLTILKILWFLYTVGAKLATIGLACYILEKMFDGLEAAVDRFQGVVTI